MSVKNIPLINLPLLLALVADDVGNVIWRLSAPS